MTPAGRVCAAIAGRRGSALSAPDGEPLIAVLAFGISAIVGMTFTMALREATRSFVPDLAPILRALRRVHDLSAVVVSALPTFWLTIVSLGWAPLGGLSVLGVAVVATSAWIAAAAWNHADGRSAIAGTDGEVGRIAVGVTMFAAVGAELGGAVLRFL